MNILRQMQKKIIMVRRSFILSLVERLTMKRITFINRNNVFVKLNNGHV